MKNLHILCIAVAALVVSPAAQAQQKANPKAQSAATNAIAKRPGAKGANAQFPKTPLQSRGLGSGTQNVLVGGSETTRRAAAPTKQALQDASIAHAAAMDSEVWFILVGGGGHRCPEGVVAWF